MQRSARSCGVAPDTGTHCVADQNPSRLSAAPDILQRGTDLH
jgi:hypothetical protein